MSSGIAFSRIYMVEKDGLFADATLVAEVDQGSPYTITGLPSNSEYDIYATNVDTAGNESEPSLALTAGTLEYTPSPDDPLSPADEAFVDAVVAEAFAAGNGPGIAISITGPRGYLHKAYGVAVKDGRALTTDDHFRMGSCTKLFTSTAVGMCIDQGLLSLDDTLDMYVPDVPFGDQITLRHLMLMRSGIHDYMTDQYVLIGFYLFPANNFSAASALRLIKKGGKAPGLEYAYTNGTHVLLGLCVEAVTGRNIRTVILEDIVAPLGLTETSWPVKSNGIGGPALPAPFARGYGGLKGPNEDATGYNIPALTDAAGALVTTLGDLQTFGQAVRDGELLTSGTHALFEQTWCPVPFDPHGIPNAPSATGYGLARVRMGDWIGHPGSVPGYECCMLYEPTSGAVFAAFENSQSAPDGIAISTLSRIFPQVAEYLYPSTMYTVDLAACTIPSDPVVP